MNQLFKPSLLMTALMLLSPTAWSASMNQHDHHAMSNMDMANMNMDAEHSSTSDMPMDHSSHTAVDTQSADKQSETMPAKPSEPHQHNTVAEVNADHSQHESPTIANQTTAITTAKQTRSPDYSDGIQSHASAHMHDDPNFWSIDAEKLQVARQNSDQQYTGQYDLRLWYGNSKNRLYLNNTGEFEKSKLNNASTEIAWWHAISPYWNTSLGIKQDYGHSSKDQSLASIGINGVAPYWFDLGANLYVSKDGDTQLDLSASYDLYITQKLVFQPNLEGVFYGKNNAEYQYGSGLASIESGFKLRYDITPQLSPYIGFEHQRFFGKTADYIRQDGATTHLNQATIGLRFWY